MKRHKKSERSQLQQVLNSLTKEELVELVQQLCGISDDASRFVQTRFSPEKDPKKRIAPYRAVIAQRFLFQYDIPPDLDFGLITKTIDDYHRVAGDVSGVLSLQLFALEKATSFMSGIGIHDALFFQELTELLSDFADLLVENPQLYSQFASRIRKVKQQTRIDAYGYSTFAHEKFSELEDAIKGSQSNSVKSGLVPLR